MWSSFHCHLLPLLPLSTMLPPANREVERDGGTSPGNRATDAVTHSSPSPCESTALLPFSIPVCSPSSQAHGELPASLPLPSLPQHSLAFTHSTAWAPQSSPGTRDFGYLENAGCSRTSFFGEHQECCSSEVALNRILWTNGTISRPSSGHWHFPCPHCQPQSLPASHTCHPLH